MSRFAVVGHVEWVDFLRVARVPVPGEIIEARESWSEAAGGGAVAAVQLAKLAGAATFFTALGGDDRARGPGAQLPGQGGELEAVILHRSRRWALVSFPLETTICPGPASPRSTVSTSRAGITQRFAPRARPARSSPRPGPETR